MVTVICRSKYKDEHGMNIHRVILQSKSKHSNHAIVYAIY